MIDSAQGTTVAPRTGRFRAGGYMQGLIRRLEADVEARKRPRTELWAGLRTGALVLGVLALAFELGARSVDNSAGWAARARLHSLNTDLDGMAGTLALQQTQIERYEKVIAYSTRYRIGADLAMAIHDIALAEGIDPQLAFELVRVESEFNPRAMSPVGALGYTQLMPATAAFMVPGITREQIYDRDTNLRLGFRFLRALVNRYNGDVRLALLAYNRGPETVDRHLRAGRDPGNGYARLVLGKHVAF